MHNYLLASILILLPACSGSSDDIPADASTGGTGTTMASGDATASGDTPTSSGGLVCGNGLLDEGEDCDGAELGGKACFDIDAAKPLGSLVCAGDCRFDSSGCNAAGSLVALNEVTSIGSEDGPYIDDAIELHNPYKDPVDLSGWILSDHSAFPGDKTYVFPVGTILAPAEFLVLTRSDLPFGLSNNDEETVYLANADGALIDRVTVEGVDAWIAYCRLPDGVGLWQRCDSTLGGANVAASSICGNGTREGKEPCEGADLGGADCTALGYAGGALSCTAACVLQTGTCTAVSPVVLNEVSSSDDGIELFNSSDTPVDISGWLVTDDPVGPDYDPMLDVLKANLPAGTILEPGGYLVLPQGNLPGHHPFGLNEAGDMVTLLQADLSFVDQVAYSPGLAETSYCRHPDGPGNPWVADCIPTFGSVNAVP